MSVKRKKGSKRILLLIIIAGIFYFYRNDISLNNIFAGEGMELFESESGGSIRSKTGLLLDLDSGEIAYKKNIDKKIYPASLTKIMTALVGLENIDSLDRTVLIKEEDFKGVLENGASTSGLRTGDWVTNRDLLYGIILRSGAESSNALANNLGGYDNFINLMNEKARELGMKDTHFTNVTGLHDDDHYTTARDLAKLLSYALDNGDFRAIITREEYLSTTGVLMKSRVYERLARDRMNGYNIIGGKTGYTDKAGLCLASICEKDGREYILITTGAKGGPDTIQYNFMDAYSIYDSYL